MFFSGDFCDSVDVTLHFRCGYVDQGNGGVKAHITLILSRSKLSVSVSYLLQFFFLGR